jgi:hypothetical protein
MMLFQRDATIKPPTDKSFAISIYGVDATTVRYLQAMFALSSTQNIQEAEIFALKLRHSC